MSTGTNAPQTPTLPESPDGETYDVNPLQDVTSHEFRVAMVPLRDIGVDGAEPDEAAVQNLVDSIADVGLQNSIVVVLRDREGHPARYQIVSGRKRYAAYKKLGREQIPAHILTFAPDDPHQDALLKLAEYHENLVRTELLLVELCVTLGKSKAAYEDLYPTTKQGKAPKKLGKDPGTRSIPFVLDAARRLGKSRATVGKLLQIFKELIEPGRLGNLPSINHDILAWIFHKP